MSQLYHVLRRVISFGLDLYFVDIQSHGVENVPKWGPVIFAANHPNSIMDTMILGFCSERQVHYMARSGLFEHLPLKFIFDRCGVIPVYRSQDGETWEEVHLFPEGIYAVTMATETWNEQ